jgi:parallel beta-helix repeat protein
LASFAPLRELLSHAKAQSSQSGNEWHWYLIEISQVVADASLSGSLEETIMASMLTTVQLFKSERTMNWAEVRRLFAFIAFSLLGLMPEVAQTQSLRAERGNARPEISVGIDAGDLRGGDHRALQAAVDYVAGLGGGTVRIGPGRYEMRNALMLRSNVQIVGEPGKTVLAACDGVKVRLAADGDANERQITLEDPSAFRLGDGVVIRDKSSGNGFAVTTGTLVARVDERTFRISRPLYLDYMVSGQASASLAFPVVGGWNIENSGIEGITVEGNRQRCEYLDGCRGGGIYLFECANVNIRDCTVRDYKGDGISFQVSSKVTVENCLVENNDGLGLHPGSGSQSPVLRRNRSIGNGQDGLYVCWRVKHGLFEHNEIRGNQRVGISIGHKDTDNLFRHNIIESNADAGVLFRSESEAMGAHRNVFEENRIIDNGRASKTASQIQIVINGPHHDLIFRRNKIGRSIQPADAVRGIVASREANGLKVEANEFINVKSDVEWRKEN